MRHHPHLPTSAHALVAALVLGLLVVLVPASPPAADAAAAPSELERRAEDVITDLHDVARTEPGRFGYGQVARQAPLTGWSDLRDVARRWAAEMGQRRQLSHSPASERGICCAVATAENVGYRTLPSLEPGAVVAAARGIFQAWMDSSGHRANITDGRFDDVGVGVRITPHGSGHVVYVAVEFRDRDPSRTPDGVVYHRPARDVRDTCGGARDAGYRDVAAGNAHRVSIDCVTAHGIATGTSDRRYEPARALNRAQLASFLVRTLRAGDVALPSRPRDHFDDDDGDVHEHSLNVLAEIGVIDRSDRRVGPAVVVTREEMARWTAAALVHGGGIDPGRRVGDHFGDDEGSGAQDAINRLADAGVVTGAGDGTFGTRVALRRDQMATFLARGLDLLLDT